MDEYLLKTYYIKYLKEIRKVSDSTVKHYLDAMKYVSKYLVQKEKLKQSVFEIQDINELEVIKAYLYTDPDFVSLDKRGHQMYSAGLNNYFRFASGDGFVNIHKKIEVMDIEVPVKDKQLISATKWKRSVIIKLQSIKAAGYECEVNVDHRTFIVKSNGKPYMEGHHALPLKYQDNFDMSLDVYANIVCLCPICHRFLHYGIDSEKKDVMDKIYFERADRVAASGIRISKGEFEELVV